MYTKPSKSGHDEEDEYIVTMLASIKVGIPERERDIAVG